MEINAHMQCVLQYGYSKAGTFANQLKIVQSGCTLT